MNIVDKRNIIVIGASAGGLDAIKKLVSTLPADLDAAIFIVWHMSADVKGILPQVLNRQQTIPASHAVNREAISFGRIYVAPPDKHLVLEKGFMRLTDGPKENNFRPAVDPLFRSAALHFGARVIGIILSGGLHDGTAGLWAIKNSGGIAIVQDPADAEMPSMPSSAIREVVVDHVLPVAEMAARLILLTAEEVNISATHKADTIRVMEESVNQLNHMGDHFAEVNQPHVAAHYFNKAKEAMDRLWKTRHPDNR